MIIGYSISGSDNDSYLFPDGWGKSICEVSDFVLNRENYINGRFSVKRKNKNLSNTYDGATIVSQKFRDFCLRNSYLSVQFYQLEKQPELYLMKVNSIVEFDTDRRQTRFEDFNQECNMYNSIVGANPVCLKTTNALSDNFNRTDILFGSGYEQHPLTIIGVETFKKMKAEKFNDIDFHPIQDVYEWENKDSI